MVDLNDASLLKIINGSHCQSCLKQLVSQDPGWARRPPMSMWGLGDFLFLYSKNYLFTKFFLSPVNNNKLFLSETRFGFHYRVDLVAGVVREGWVLKYYQKYFPWSIQEVVSSRKWIYGFLLESESDYNFFAQVCHFWPPWRLQPDGHWSVWQVGKKMIIFAAKKELIFNLKYFKVLGAVGDQEVDKKPRILSRKRRPEVF